MILPSLVLLYIWVGIAIQKGIKSRLSKLIVSGLVLWLVLETAFIYPNYLTYFNQFVGGPDNGHHYAIDSNLDWGQDLTSLREYLEAHEIKTIQLLYYGRVDPSIYGIDYTVPRIEVTPGYLAISRSLYGRDYILNDHRRIIQAGPYDEVRFNWPKIATLGNTIDIYEIADRSPLPEMKMHKGIQ